VWERRPARTRDEMRRWVGSVVVVVVVEGGGGLRGSCCAGRAVEGGLLGALSSLAVWLDMVARLLGGMLVRFLRGELEGCVVACG
jgi:hypothetical protein